ncbi:MAG: hypothetical protein MJ252_24220 [archaeon]|nr:hypothetical protein [archaeon]
MNDSQKAPELDILSDELVGLADSQSQKDSNQTESHLGEIIPIIKSAISTQDPNPKETSSLIKDIFYNSLYGNLKDKKIFKDSLDEVISQLMELTISTDKTENLLEYFNLMEELFFFMIFHFDSAVSLSGLTLEGFMIENTSTEYHKGLMMKLIKIIQILHLKRGIDLTPIVIKTHLMNLGFAIYVLLDKSPKETKTVLFDFIKKNYSELNLIYLFTLAFNNEGNDTYLWNYFSIDELTELLDKFKKEMDKKIKALDSFINYHKNDGTINTKTQKINQMESISLLSKIIISFSKKDSMSYNLEKIYKDFNSFTQNISEMLCEHFKAEDNLNLRPEMMFNLLMFLESFNFFTLRNITSFIQYMQLFIQIDLSYLKCEEFLVQIFERLLFGEETDQSGMKKRQGAISKAIMKMIENIFKSKDEFKYDQNSLYYITKMFEVILRNNPEYTFTKNEFPKTYEIFVEGNYGKETNFKEENSEVMFNNYQRALKKEETALNPKKFTECLKKFEDFSTSMKECFNLGDTKLGYEKNIENFKSDLENKKENKVNVNAFQKFYLDCTIDMYTEIFKTGQ